MQPCTHPLSAIVGAHGWVSCAACGETATDAPALSRQAVKAQKAAAAAAAAATLRWEDHCAEALALANSHR